MLRFGDDNFGGLGEDNDKEENGPNGGLLSDYGAVLHLCLHVCDLNFLQHPVHSKTRVIRTDSLLEKDATITMGILSVFYFTLNIGFLVDKGLEIFKCNLDIAQFCSNPAFENTSMYVLLPLNSACNPIVYFVRNREMRKYLTKMWRRMTGLCRNTEMNMEDRQANNTVSMSGVARERTEE